jgi:2'-5' RNA ligase
MARTDGARSGAAASALVVPVPAATASVGPLRNRLDTTAAHGVPAHITVLYPFVAPAEIRADDERRLAALFAGAKPFDFALRTIGWFGDELLYLRPDPAEPFVALTRLVMATYPAYPPYSGAHRDITPHLTIGEGPLTELRRAAQAVAPSLPIAAHAGDVWLMVGSPELRRWQVRARFPLGGRPE